MNWEFMFSCVFPVFPFSILIGWISLSLLDVEKP
jgi:hypothetical protein